MGFGNPIVGGTALRIPAIQSPNFATGVSGWIIRIDGSAEFSNIVIRGSTTGDTVIIGPSTGSQILIGYSGTTSEIKFPMHSPAEATASEIFGRVQNSGTTSELLDLNLQGPKITGGNTITQTIGSGNPSGTIPARWSVVQNGTQTLMFMDTVNGIELNEPATVNTAVGQVPLTLNAPSSPGANLMKANTGATDQVIIDASGVLTTYAANQFTTYTPSWGNTGGATFTTNTGYYQRVGKMVFFSAYGVVNPASPGAGAGNVTVTAPSSIDRTTRQHVDAHTESLTAGNNGSSTALAFTSGSGSTFDRIRNPTNGSITGADLLGNGIISVEGWYRET